MKLFGISLLELLSFTLHYQAPPSIRDCNILILFLPVIDISDNAGTNREKTLNPSYTTQTLTCELTAHNEEDIAYNWTSAVDKERETYTRVLTLQARGNIDTEVIICSGTIGGLGDKYIYMYKYASEMIFSLYD